MIRPYLIGNYSYKLGGFMVGKKAKHYVNNKDFFLAIVEYQALCKVLREQGKPLPSIPNYIGVCIDMICKKLSLKINFIRYTYLEEMIDDGIMNCCAAVDNFKPEVSNNPFSYFTSVAWNAYIHRIEKETAQNYTKHKNLENMMVLSDEFYSELGSSEYTMSGGRSTSEYGISGTSKADNEGLQRHYDVIRNFEAKQARKKEKTRQATLNKLKNSKPIISKRKSRSESLKKKGQDR